MAKIVNPGGGPLNWKVANMLGGVTDADERTLVDLLRSDEPIDQMTRKALADAFERTEGLRLQLVKDRKRPRPLSAKIKTWHEYQQITDDVRALQQELSASRGIPPERCEKEAKGLVAQRRGISLDKVKDALAYSRRAVFRINRVEG